MCAAGASHTLILVIDAAAARNRRTGTGSFAAYREAVLRRAVVLGHKPKPF